MWRWTVDARSEITLPFEKRNRIRFVILYL